MDKPGEINGHRAGPAWISAACQYLWSHYQSPGESCKYLDVMVGQQDAVAGNWNNCILSVWSRLVLAREKTTTVEQRAQITSAISIPKITLFARHGWPPLAVVTRLHSLNIDFVWGVRNGKRSRPWVPSEIATLLIQQGDKRCLVFRRN